MIDIQSDSVTSLKVVAHGIHPSSQLILHSLSQWYGRGESSEI